MKIKMMSDRVVNGKPAKAGSTVETNEKDAKYLIQMGYAEVPKAAEKEPKK